MAKTKWYSKENRANWNSNIQEKLKRNLSESCVTYCAKIWVLNKSIQERLHTLWMDFWRESASISRIKHIWNEVVWQIMLAKKPKNEEIKKLWAMTKFFPYFARIISQSTGHSLLSYTSVMIRHLYRNNKFTLWEM